MRFGAGPFKLMAPKVAPENLPENWSSKAVNCRILSGALEPWKSNRIEPQLVTKEGTIRTIALMDPDGSDGDPVLLQWTQIASVVRSLRPNDTSDETYFTGVGAPKVTNRSLATGGSQDLTGYPQGWYTLGAPTPTDAPVLNVASQEVAENEIVIDNPFAEAVPTEGWTSTIGTLGRTDESPLSGNWSFIGGDEALTEGEQAFDVQAVLGGKLKLTYQRLSDETDPATGGRARMGVRFYDDTTTLIVDADVFDAWGDDGLREVIADIPAEAVTARAVMEFERTGTGPGAADAFIDEIHVFELEPAGAYFKGDLTGWSRHNANAPSLEVVDMATEPGTWPTSFGSSYRFEVSGGARRAMYRDFSVADAASYTVETRFWLGGASSPEAQLFFGLTDSGSAAYVRFYPGAIAAGALSDWKRGAMSVVSGYGVLKNRIYYVKADITRTGEKQKAKITVTYQDDPDPLLPRWARVPSGGDIFADSFTFDVPELPLTASGNYLGFAAEYGGSSDSSERAVVYDWMKIQVRPKSQAESGGQEVLSPGFTNYVYTIRNGFGYISAPSPASVDITLAANHSVTVTTSTTVPSDYGTGWLKDLWRLVTATDGTTVYRLLATIPIGTANYLDTKPDSELEEDILPSIGWSVWPTDAHSVVVAANGITYMASKNQVIPSPVNQPHACLLLPPSAQTTDTFVVTLVAIDSDVYALTKAHPYVITGSNPLALASGKLKKPLGCVSRPSVATSDRVGVIYSAADGLAFCNRADVGLLTKDLLSEREWNWLNPTSIHGAVYDGWYIGFYTGGGWPLMESSGGFIVDIDGGTGFGLLDFYASAIWVNPTSGNLHMVIDGEHVTFNTGTGYLTYDWTSKRYLIDRPASPQHARLELAPLETGDVSFYASYDGTHAFLFNVSDSDEFNLTDDDASHSIVFRLQGARSVRRFTMVELIEEMIG